MTDRTTRISAERRKGKTIAQIASVLGISERTVYRCLSGLEPVGEPVAKPRVAATLPARRNRNPALARAVRSALGEPGATVAAVALEMGVSERTVYRVKDSARTNGTEIGLSPPSPIAIIEARLPDDLLKKMDSVLSKGVDFLDRATSSLDPKNRDDVKLMAVHIVSTLSDVAANIRKVQTVRPGQETPVASMSDEELVAEASRVLSTADPEDDAPQAETQMHVLQ
jgi:transposase